MFFHTQKPLNNNCTENSSPLMEMDYTIVEDLTEVINDVVDHFCFPGTDMGVESIAEMLGFLNITGQPDFIYATMDKRDGLPARLVFGNGSHEIVGSGAYDVLLQHMTDFRELSRQASERGEILNMNDVITYLSRAPLSIITPLGEEMEVTYTADPLLVKSKEYETEKGTLTIYAIPFRVMSENTNPDEIMNVMFMAQLN